MSILLQDKRKTRGTRINDLIGEAVEQDEQFWAHSVWKEDEDDESFGSEDEEEKPDEFDSDFDESEEEDEEGEQEDEKRPMVKKSSTNKYKEPKQVKPKRSASEVDDAPTPKKKPKLEKHIDETSILTFERGKRESTKVKSEVSMVGRKVRESKPKPTPSRPAKHHFTQKQLLEDALETEVISKSLVSCLE